MFACSSSFVALTINIGEASKNWKFADRGRDAVNSPDSVLLLGSGDAKLKAFLQKMGYSLFESVDGTGIHDHLDREVIDIVVVDDEIGGDVEELCTFLRGHDKTKDIPILLLSSDTARRDEITKRELDRIEFVDAPCSVGSLVSKIATELRVRKLKGENEDQASLSEINASLRDLNNRFKKELEEARAIQQSLLPKRLPAARGMEIAASYEPLEEVGGDWLYVSKTSEGKMSVQIADVTGHGLSAAFICSMTKLAMTAAAKELPHELLQEMNRLMAPQMPEGKFVTMFSYLYDPQTGHLDYARAGHPPGLLLRKKKGEVEQLLGDGFAIGFFEESEYSQQETSLEPGDILLIMTDALPEGLNMSGEAYGYDRMSELMLRLAEDASPTRVIAEVIRDFEKFRAGRILKDDVTLIALKRTE